MQAEKLISDMAQNRPIRLNQAKFTVAAHKSSQWPQDIGSEVAFAGRSNSGKSSALNTIVQRKGLAVTSRTPGRTRQIVFFEIDPTKRLVDLPGYGYSKVPESMRIHWAAHIEQYFKTRSSLSGLILTTDIRHPLKPLDQQLIDLSLDADIPVHVLLTKSDKLSRSRASAALASAAAAFREVAQVSVQVFSSHNRSGLDAAIQVIVEMLETPLR